MKAPLQPAHSGRRRFASHAWLVREDAQILYGLAHQEREAFRQLIKISGDRSFPKLSSRCQQHDLGGVGQAVTVQEADVSW